MRGCRIPANIRYIAVVLSHAVQIRRTVIVHEFHAEEIVGVVVIRCVLVDPAVVDGLEPAADVVGVFNGNDTILQFRMIQEMII